MVKVYTTLILDLNPLMEPSILAMYMTDPG